VWVQTQPTPTHNTYLFSAIGYLKLSLVLSILCAQIEFFQINIIFLQVETQWCPISNIICLMSCNRTCRSNPSNSKTLNLDFCSFILIAPGAGYVLVTGLGCNALLQKFTLAELPKNQVWHFFSEPFNIYFKLYNAVFLE
jgi:hypothetical protein